MKLPTFRKDAAAGLRKAQDALAAVEARIVELEGDRRVALQETDATAPVIAADKALAEARVEASIYRDRIATLKATVAEQRAEEQAKQYAAAIAVIEQRLTDQVELAGEVEAAVRHLGDTWNRLINWRQSIISGWPEGLPLPRSTDFQDLKDLRRELAVLLFSAGKPAWNRPPSIPAPAGPIGVAGLEPRGLAKYVEGAGRAFIARLKMQMPVSNPEDETESSAA
jgi:hypothetical protein